MSHRQTRQTTLNELKTAAAFLLHSGLVLSHCPTKISAMSNLLNTLCLCTEHAQIWSRQEKKETWTFSSQYFLKRSTQTTSLQQVGVLNCLKLLSILQAAHIAVLSAFSFSFHWQFFAKFKTFVCLIITILN